VKYIWNNSYLNCGCRYLYVSTSIVLFRVIFDGFMLTDNQICPREKLPLCFIDWRFQWTELMAPATWYPAWQNICHDFFEPPTIERLYDTTLSVMCHFRYIKFSLIVRLRGHKQKKWTNMAIAKLNFNLENSPKKIRALIG